MLPKWFNDWNKANPTNVFGPAIAIGIVGSAVFVAALVVTWGNPLQTESMQTGPRGTGMSVPEYNVSRLAEDPTIAGYSSSPPVVPGPDAVRAGDVIENAEPLLADLTPENYERVVNAMRTWVGINVLFNGEENYQTVVARRMIQMTQNLNENWASHVNVNGNAGVNCYTCHRGEAVPSDIWFNVTPVNENVGGWAAVQNRATSMSSSTSLPSSALEVYLTDYDSQVNVHDLESRVAGVPGIDEDVATIQKTEMTYSLMNYFSNSLGVNCVFCHNSRAFYDPAQVTPQWSTALLGRQMVIELNQEYLIPLGEVYPPERLGPIFADAPKVGCRTCHKGYQKPLQGMNMVADWPELATTGAPVYE
ncbi:photosynthetic reaction center cytochrome PufC [Tateyamaria sp. ANG-S1]|uniref:photosynthetic reaction center cytochrome PufC n=1 Tax=Tateyamaria sp. ANG-S1 TaxID=1577905 RepID=UPI00057D6907|nr:photosynthetic reaction center cytochrome PufC [Tateyamaria sp. ANG-S1]KIC47882.1 Photosynthetic reaction center cytochrome C subunit [Tateyamaria sp. ANG-S1]